MHQSRKNSKSAKAKAKARANKSRRNKKRGGSKECNNGWHPSDSTINAFINHYWGLQVQQSPGLEKTFRGSIRFNLANQALDSNIVHACNKNNIGGFGGYCMNGSPEALANFNTLCYQSEQQQLEAGRLGTQISIKLMYNPDIDCTVR